MYANSLEHQLLLSLKFVRRAIALKQQFLNQTRTLFPRNAKCPKLSSCSIRRPPLTSTTTYAQWEVTKITSMHRGNRIGRAPFFRPQELCVQSQSSDCSFAVLMFTWSKGRNKHFLVSVPLSNRRTWKICSHLIAIFF